MVIYPIVQATRYIMNTTPELTLRYKTNNKHTFLCANYVIKAWHYAIIPIIDFTFVYS